MNGDNADRVLDLARAMADPVKTDLMARIATSRSRGETMMAILAMGFAATDLMALAKELTNEMARRCGDPTLSQAFLPTLMEAFRGDLLNQGIDISVTILEKEKAE